MDPLQLLTPPNPQLNLSQTLGLQKVEFSKQSPRVVQKHGARSAQLHQNENLEFAQIIAYMLPPKKVFHPSTLNRYPASKKSLSPPSSPRQSSSPSTYPTDCRHPYCLSRLDPVAGQCSSPQEIWPIKDHLRWIPSKRSTSLATSTNASSPPAGDATPTPLMHVLSGARLTLRALSIFRPLYTGWPTWDGSSRHKLALDRSAAVASPRWRWRSWPRCQMDGIHCVE